MKIEQDVKFLQPCWNCGATILFGKLIPQLETCEICHGTRRVLTEAGEEIKDLLEHLDAERRHNQAVKDIEFIRDELAKR